MIIFFSWVKKRKFLSYLCHVIAILSCHFGSDCDKCIVRRPTSCILGISLPFSQRYQSYLKLFEVIQKIYKNVWKSCDTTLPSEVSLLIWHLLGRATSINKDFSPLWLATAFMINFIHIYEWISQGCEKCKFSGFHHVWAIIGQQT